MNFIYNYWFYLCLILILIFSRYLFKIIKNTIKFAKNSKASEITVNNLGIVTVKFEEDKNKEINKHDIEEIKFINRTVKISTWTIIIITLGIIILIFFIYKIFFKKNDFWT